MPWSKLSRASLAESFTVLLLFDFAFSSGFFPWPHAKEAVRRTQASVQAFTIRGWNSRQVHSIIPAMPQKLIAKTLTATLPVDAPSVYARISDPHNLSDWHGSFCRSIE